MTSTAPVLSQSICQGTILLWCSIAEINTSSPGFKIEVNPFATKLIPKWFQVTLHEKI
jgi:hypothetical protein